MFQHGPRTTALRCVSAAVALSALALTGCGDSDGPADVSVEEIQEGPEQARSTVYDGAYGRPFAEGITAYYGRDVVVTADVGTVVDGSAFTVVDPTDDTVDPLLVVGAQATRGLEPETSVRITGTVYEALDLTRVEEDLGTDLDEKLFGAYDSQPYLQATSVDPTAATGD
ncbi:hypothetical protein AB2L28_17765 [Kineococcus sp. TBRC 1896]|uniref:Uncharacterized protein n=1 Tax=Kineococcus mangrovi TaxID=1660183 RepID=A0ABV4I5X4_9ACTN